MDYEGCCGDGAPPPEMVADAKETVSLREQNARLQTRVEEAEGERDLALAGVRVTERERDEARALAERRKKGWCG